MKKTFAILALMLCSIAVCRAGNPRKVVFGTEWGYSPTLYRDYKYVYNDEYGTTVPEMGAGFHYDGDLFFLARAGVRMGKYSELSLQSGLMGIAERRKCVPILLRYSYAFEGMERDGAILYADGGIGLPLSRPNNIPAFIGRIGSGYRLLLARGTSLDFTAGVRAYVDHPCDKASVRKNESFNLGASLGISLNF